MDNKFTYIYPKEKVAAGQYQKKKVEKKKDAVYSGKTAYLTFDDGPSSNTGGILDELNRQGIKATFFVIGTDSGAGRSMYKRIAGEGHQLGNHTYSHNYSSIYSSVQNFISDFLRLENLLYDTVGIRPKMIRYPGGSNNTVSHRYGGAGMMRQIISEMSSRGYTHCDWNVDAGDATSAINNKSAIVRNVLSQAAGKDKTIVLLHDAEYQKNTPAALSEIIQGLRAQGFAFDVLLKNSYLVQFAK